jgi:A/G-specific adenine glycosylase
MNAVVNQSDFQELIWQKGRELYRDMPWRQDTRPYYVLVSELMLQQTQVDRVVPKFLAFIQAFPDEKTLAGASLADVLTLWNGLGYNRRAKFLHDTAKKVVTDFSGVFPDDRKDLLTLPGVGPGTAGAIMTYAFNQPSIFIETNVRTVYFHHFFADHETVSDAELVPVIEATLDQEHPREFYWALMDYGTWLKKNGAGSIRRSSHYKKQSPLKGSVREVRGQIVTLLSRGDMKMEVLKSELAADKRFEPALTGLIADGLVTQTHTILHLTK